jgi:hypothetical protein
MTFVSCWPAWLQVKVKMSVEGFLKNNRGINDGADLDPDFMRALYDRIVSNEIKVSAVLCALCCARCALELRFNSCVLQSRMLHPWRQRCIICNPTSGIMRGWTATRSVFSRFEACLDNTVTWQV